MSPVASAGIVKTLAARTPGGAAVDFLAPALFRPPFSTAPSSFFGSSPGIFRGTTDSTGSQGLIKPFEYATQIATNKSGSLEKEKRNFLSF